jgi:hypothetical protein
MNDETAKLDGIAALWLTEPQTEIARQIGLSTGAVCGLVMRARRNGDPRFPSRPNPARSRRTKPKAPPRLGKVRPSAIVEPEPQPEPKDELPVPFARLRAGQCKFVVNDARRASGFLFCAQPATRGNYCEIHAAQTRVSGSASPRPPFRPEGRPR